MKCDMCGSVMRTVKKIDMGEVYACDKCMWCVINFNAGGHQSRIIDLK